MFTLDFSPDPSRSQRTSNRRHFLQVGGLSSLGLSAATLLQAQAVAAKDREDSASRGDQSPHQPQTRAKSVLLVYLGGGLSHHDSFDLKPEASAEIRGQYKPIASNVAGLDVGELLPLMSQSMDKVCLVRSGAHTNDHHETATNWVLSGRFGSAFGDWPAIGAVAAHQLGFSGELPPYVAVPRNPSFTWELGRSAFLGGRYESFKAGDPNSADFRVRDLSLPGTMAEARVNRRQKLLDVVDGLARGIEGNDQILAYDEYQQRAASMVLSGKAKEAFAIEKESPAIRDRFGRNTFGQSCLLARRLVERGVRFVTVNYGGWDHHATIFPSLNKKLPEFDQGFSALVNDLTERHLTEETLVVCMGEFGRTPRINKDQGRDHWAPAASLLFLGAGVKTGTVIGATDREGAYTTSKPFAPADVAFTILDSLGIDPRKHIFTPDGRPVEILDSGRLMNELFTS